MKPRLHSLTASPRAAAQGREDFPGVAAFQILGELELEENTT